MPASKMAVMGSFPPRNSGSPPPRMTLVASSTVWKSLRGMPIMSQITRSGNGWDRTSTRSASPCSQNPSITSAQMVSTESSTPWSWRGVNERDTMPRWRACRGSSMLMNEPKNSSASAGMSGIDTAPWPEQNSLGRRLISTTSSKRVTASKVSRSPVSGLSNETGTNASCSRMVANWAMRSARGWCQKDGSASRAPGDADNGGTPRSGNGRCRKR